MRVRMTEKGFANSNRAKSYPIYICIVFTVICKDIESHTCQTFSIIQSTISTWVTTETDEGRRSSQSSSSKVKWWVCSNICEHKTLLLDCAWRWRGKLVHCVAVKAHNLKLRFHFSLLRELKKLERGEKYQILHVKFKRAATTRAIY